MGKFSSPRGTTQQEPVTSGKKTAAQRKSSPARKKAKKIVLICLCTVAVVLLIAAIIGVWYFVGWPTDDGLILKNISAGGIDLGGLTQEQATQVLKQATDSTYTQKDMVIELPDATLTLSPSDTGAQLNVEAVVEEAYNYGRVGTLEEREQAQADAASNGYTIALVPYLNLDLDYIRGELEAYGESFNSEYAASSIEVEGEMPILDVTDEKFDPETPGQVITLSLGNPGRYVDIEDLYNDVLDAYSFNTFQLTVGMSKDEKIPEELDLQALYDEYYSAPVDATMDKETYEVTSEIYGYGFDLEAAQLQLEQAQYGDSFQIQLNLIAPEVSGEALSSVLFRDVLASYETAHTKDSNRNTNLTLACAAINGLVLEPGETFDYNDVVGKRTAEAGYKSADAYSGGKTVKTLGGGICQVSSTIYYCCLIADLEIVDRSPHSYVSSYMPMGMDATVSWGGPEFRFKNNTNYPIRIETEVSGGYVKVKLIGTDEKDYYIEMEYEVISRESPTTVYEEFTANNNPEGYKDGQVISTAYTGYTVQTYKLKYDKETGELISRDKDQLSKYKKRDKTIAKLVTSLSTETQPTEAPTEAPTQAPTEAPAPTDAPVVETPATEPPAAETPATEPPAAETPAETPAEGSQDGT